MPVEGLPGDAQFGAQLGDLGFGLAHRGLGEPKLGWRHLERPPAMPATRPSRSEAGSGTLDDQLALELSEAGEDREDETAIGGGGVDRRAFARQYSQPDAALGQVAHQIDEMAQVAPQPVELPHDQRVTVAERLEAGV